MATAHRLYRSDSHTEIEIPDLRVEVHAPGYLSRQPVDSTHDDIRFVAHKVLMVMFAHSRCSNRTQWS